MRIVRTLAEIPPAYRGASAAIGNFDGVHLGHRAVIDLAREVQSGPLAVLTFEPHPREVFRPDAPPFRLMDAAARSHQLEELGVEILFELPFNETLRQMTDSAFCEHVLHEGLGLSHVTVGADFRYGKGRSGTATSLKAAGAALGFGVTVADLIKEATDDNVSSTAIRAALTAGDPRRAALMLGHWHRFEGPVIHGEKRGRTLGYPTANMSVGGRHPPRFGVYAVTVDVLAGPYAGQYDGAASLGVRPMFGENQPNLETFLFDFKGDLYGTPISVALIDFLRPEMKFDSLDGLLVQMEKDCSDTRQILKSL
jgi:riboflavin kinase/FMN adenylyltransferase